MEKIRSFEDLEVWKVGRDLRRQLYVLAAHLQSTKNTTYPLRFGEPPCQ